MTNKHKTSLHKSKLLYKNKLNQNLPKEHKHTHTMEKMFSKCIIRHKLRNQQPLIAVTAVPNQIRQFFVSQFPNSLSFLLHPKHKKIKSNS